MVEHEVTVETETVEKDTVTFCDYCGNPEETVDEMHNLSTDGITVHGTAVGEPSPQAGWSDREGDGGREYLKVSTASDPAGDMVTILIDDRRQQVGHACGRCLERLQAAEIPHPGSIRVEDDEEEGETDPYDRGHDTPAVWIASFLLVASPLIYSVFGAAAGLAAAAMGAFIAGRYILRVGRAD